MTTFVFVRHGENDVISTKIAGRKAGLHLNEAGRQQARHIADALGDFPIDAIYAGPLERACETAEPLCQRLHLPLQIADEFNEIEFGDWTGEEFTDLRKKGEFQVWNSLRSFSAPPDGEMMLAVQARVVARLRELRARHQFVVIFSHGDVIRATIAYALGVPLDLFQRIQVDSASISAVELGDETLRVRLVNGSSDQRTILPNLARPF
ncbi:MAG: histidine phosphatase family protein [Chthoniobacterales bacterium]